MCQFCIKLIGTNAEDRAQPQDEAVCLPFTGSRCPLAQMRLAAASSAGTLSDFTTKEEMAYALSQVSARNILPPLTELACGTDLLGYRVRLRHSLDHNLVDELAMVLSSKGSTFHWERIRLHSYLCVIGAGVGACLDMTPGEEVLYLRYASTLENELFHAGRTLDLPRSRLFLQATLYERFDLLLADVRQRAWYWLYGESRNTK